ncbi:MAG: isoleucine--tRNA ligase [Actinobacteria bacterium]|nr:isoleucine--tRNA ligase [Actinomycetota bacterium]
MARQVFTPLDPSEKFPQIEERVLARWRDADVFHRSLKQRENAERFVFYEGPPTANGRPGSHHVLSRVFKDIFPRYKTMRGYRVDRKAGWDCHGLPVELEIEKELGLQSKHEIENYGIAEFNAKCRESVFTYVEEWNKLTERIGFWIDLDDPYVTLSNQYVESVWWSLKQIWDKDLLYEGHRVVPYCPRCGTALSSHEVALGYKDVKDPSVFVRFPVAGETGTYLLVWTTTPWTLPGNVAVAVAPDVTYVRLEVGDETLILAEQLIDAVIGEDTPRKIAQTLTGDELAGLRYDGPVYPLDGGGPTSTSDTPVYSVITGDFVTTEDGTGLVHIAPAFGEDDYQVAAQNNLFDPTKQETLFNPVKLDGTFDQSVTGFENRFVKDDQTTTDLIADLHSRGLLFKSKKYEHSYPHCWRCHTPLIYYAKASWYIKTTAVREQMLSGNEGITWYPPHIKHGRFGNWLENNIDWALSRERYWGTPLPVWVCDADRAHATCLGSFEEVEQKSGAMPDDPHRPYIDDVTFACEHSGCSGTMRRVPEVIDAWYDSGSMPFAQWHYPFENKDTFDEKFPAQYICEALDQTRGWFYSLLAVSTLLFEKPSYETVLCLGLILDPDGHKMSKSRGNVVAPWDVIDKHGADAFRWYYFTSKEPWAGYRFSTETVGESVRKFLLTLWNTYGFLVLYANAGGEDGTNARPLAERCDLDRWAISRLNGLIETVTERLDDYDATAAGRAIDEFVDELSNWYVRLSRRRFWDADADAIATLRECLVTTAQLLAPFTPFIADEIYCALTPAAQAEPSADQPADSVHLTDFPTADPAKRDQRLETTMSTARGAVELGRAARAQAKVKLRQPLAEAVVVAADDERSAIGRFESLICDELNVKSIRYVTDADELARVELRANFKALGPRLGKNMPLAKDAIAAIDGAAAAAAFKQGETVGLSIGGDEIELTADDVQIVLAPPDGYQLEREGTHAVALDLTITDELKREGLAREVVHAVQNARKDAGLAVEDRIVLRLGGDATLLDAARAHGDYVGGETLATALDIGDAAFDDGAVATVDGLELRIAVRKADPPSD